MKGPPFTPAQTEELARLADRYPERPSALLPLLRRAQELAGGLGERELIFVADLARVPHVRAFEVATYHPQLFVGRRGRHLVQACHNLSCDLHGCSAVLAALREHLGVGEGGTTADGLFTLATAECLGACDRAPALLVDDDLFGPVAPAGLPALLDRYRGRR